MKVSLIQLAKDPGGQVLEINEPRMPSGLAVNRNLPYGHYELTATTADGWYLTGYRSRLNVEFEKGVDAILVAPTPGKTSKVVISFWHNVFTRQYQRAAIWRTNGWQMDGTCSRTRRERS